MQHCNVVIDDFAHGTWRVSQTCTHMQNLWYDRAVHEVENTLYMTLVKGPDMKQIWKIVRRTVGRMIQLGIYKTLEMMEIGWVL